MVVSSIQAAQLYFAGLIPTSREILSHIDFAAIIKSCWSFDLSEDCNASLTLTTNVFNSWKMTFSHSFSLRVRTSLYAYNFTLALVKRYPRGVRGIRSFHLLASGKRCDERPKCFCICSYMLLPSISMGMKCLCPVSFVCVSLKYASRGKPGHQNFHSTMLLYDHGPIAVTRCSSPAPSVLLEDGLALMLLDLSSLPYPDSDKPETRRTEKESDPKQKRSLEVCKTKKHPRIVKNKPVPDAPSKVFSASPKAAVESPRRKSGDRILRDLLSLFWVNQPAMFTRVLAIFLP
mmetsp:Transcript_3775/g.9327  ORF Transcript_3775/g.9327 Transcript_3775/m.9327 type:complete len:290 (-) Transcript_3775:307-1176(-)